MDSRDYYNRKTLIELNKIHDLEMLEYEFKKCFYDKHVDTFSELQKQIQKLYIMKQKNLVEIAKMNIQIFKSTYNIQ